MSETIEELWSQVRTLKQLIAEQSETIVRKAKIYSRDIVRLKNDNRQLRYELKAAQWEVDRLERQLMAQHRKCNTCAAFLPAICNRFLVYIEDGELHVMECADSEVAEYSLQVMLERMEETTC